MLMSVPEVQETCVAGVRMRTHGLMRVRAEGDSGLLSLGVRRNSLARRYLRRGAQRISSANGTGPCRAEPEAGHFLVTDA